MQESLVHLGLGYLLKGFSTVSVVPSTPPGSPLVAAAGAASVALCHSGTLVLLGYTQRVTHAMRYFPFCPSIAAVACPVRSG